MGDQGDGDVDQGLLDEGWRIEGNDNIGRWVLREYVPNARRPEKKKACYGRIRYWLPIEVSDPFINAENKPAALWKVEYVMPPDLEGEDLEEADLPSCVIGAEIVPEHVLSRAERMSTTGRRSKEKIKVISSTTKRRGQQKSSSHQEIPKPPSPRASSKKRGRKKKEEESTLDQTEDQEATTTNKVDENNGEEEMEELKKFATRWMPRRSAKDQALNRGFRVEEAFQTTTLEERKESADLVLKAVQQAAAEQGTAWVTRRQVGKRCRQLAEYEEEANFHRIEKAVKVLIEQGKLLSLKRSNGICVALAGGTDSDENNPTAISPAADAYSSAILADTQGLSHWRLPRRAAKFIVQVKLKTDEAQNGVSPSPVENSTPAADDINMSNQDKEIPAQLDQQNNAVPTTMMEEDEPPPAVSSTKEEEEEDDVAPDEVAPMEEEEEESLEALASTAAATAVEQEVAVVRAPAKSAIALFKEERQYEALNQLLPGGYNNTPAIHWHRSVKQRVGDPSKSDCYYFGPDGSLMRSGNEVAAYLEAHPDEVNTKNREGEPVVLNREAFAFGQRAASPLELRDCPYVQQSQVSDLVATWWNELTIEQQGAYDDKLKLQQEAAQKAVRDSVRKAYEVLKANYEKNESITSNDIALMCIAKVAPLAENAWSSLGRLNKWRDLVPEEDDKNFGFSGGITESDAFASRLEEHFLNPTASITNSQSLAGGRQRSRRAAAVRSRANYVEKPATPAEIVDLGLESLETRLEAHTDSPQVELRAMTRGVPSAAMSNDLIAVSESVSQNELNKPVAKQSLAFLEAPVRAVRDGLATLVKSHRAKRFLAATDDTGIIEQYELKTSETPYYVSPADDFGDEIQKDSPAEVRSKLREQYRQRHARTLLELRALILHRLTARSMPPDEQTLQLADEAKSKYNALIGARIEIDGVLGVCINDRTAKMDDGTTRTDLTVEELGHSAARIQPAIRWPSLLPDPLHSQGVMIYWPKDACFYLAHVVATAPAPVWDPVVYPPRRPGLSYAPAHLVVYDEDSSSEWLDLRQYTVRFAKAVAAYAECYEVIELLSSRDAFGLFAEPVNPAADPELAHYRTIITNPMDFGTVYNRLLNNVYDNDASLASESALDDEEEDDLDLFVDARNDTLIALRIRRGVYRDLKLTLDNAMFFNRTSRPDIVKYAASLLKVLNATAMATAAGGASAPSSSKKANQATSTNTSANKRRREDNRLLLDDDDDDDDWDEDEDDWDDDERSRPKRARHNAAAAPKVSRYLIDNVVTLDTLLAGLPIKGDPAHFSHPPGFHLTRTMGRGGRISQRAYDSYRPVTLIDQDQADTNVEEAEPFAPLPTLGEETSKQTPQGDMTSLAMATDEHPDLNSRIEKQRQSVVQQEGKSAKKDSGNDLKFSSRSMLETNHFESLHTALFPNGPPYLGAVIDGSWEIRTACARLALAHIVGTLVATGHVVEVGTGATPAFIPAHLYMRSTPPIVEKRHRSRESTYTQFKEKSEYELMREARIEANNAFLAQLGLGNDKRK